MLAIMSTVKRSFAVLAPNGFSWSPKSPPVGHASEVNSHLICIKDVGWIVLLQEAWEDFVQSLLTGGKVGIELLPMLSLCLDTIMLSPLNEPPS